MDAADRLRPYVAGLAVDWLQSFPDARHRSVEGSLAFVDISGFTRLTERLAAKGKVGAEELSDLLDATFASLLEVAYSYGALLVKWGGDAVLLLFEGPDHARLACRAAYEMRALMRRIGRLRTSVGTVTLRMSVGVHSGAFDFFLAGRRHHELLIAGPAATTTAELEGVAEAGEVVISPQTAEQLPSRCVGAAKGSGLLLRSAPPVDPRCRFWPRLSETFDFGTCLDPALRHHILCKDADSEHRQIAIAFVEVSAVDALLRRQGPGAVANELHRLIVLVQEACGRHHVTFWETDISKDGFKILLIAGAPTTTGHDEEGLLRACRAIVDGHSGPIDVRIGANCGRAFVGDFGPDFRRTFSVKADAVNLAARVMAKATRGQLLATTAILSRSATKFDVTPLEPFLVKGKKQPVHAAAVGQAQERVVQRRDDMPFVGRDQAIETLSGALSAARAGRGGAVEVVGPAGLGKTRLIDEVVRRAEGDLRVLQAYGDSYETSTAYFPFRRLLRLAIALPPDAGEEPVIRRLTDLLSARAAHLLPWLPLLAVPLGVRIADTPETAEVAEQFRPQRIAALTIELLGLTLAGSTVVTVDDAHAIDDASIDLLVRLAVAAAGRRWLVAASTREPRLTRDDGAAATRLTLEPLTDAESKALVRAVTEARPLTGRVERAVVARAEGNPLFLLDLVDAAAASGDDIELPGTLEEMLAAQLDELPPTDRTVLRVAAVLGVRFDDGLLTALLGVTPSQQTWESLARFVVAEGGRRRFRTTLVRDAAYEGLPFRRRRDLHGRIAHEIERRAGEQAGEVAEALSLHYFQAHDYDAAWRYSLIAGDRARRMYANVEALAFLRRARVAAAKVKGTSSLELAALSEAVGDVCAAMTELEQAMAAYRDARRLTPAGPGLVRGRLALSIALAAETSGAVARSARWLSRARQELATVAPDERDAAAALDARACFERAFITYLTGHQQRAARLCHLTVGKAEAVGAAGVVARALHLLDLIDLQVGRSGGEERAVRALELFTKIGDLPRQAGLWNHLGMRSYFSGDWNAAVERYERSRAIGARCGDDWGAAIASGNIAEILVDQGRLAEAEPLVREALVVWRAAGTPNDIGFGAALLGRLCARSGRHDEAMALLTEAVDAYSVKGERFEIVDTRLRMAEVFALSGSPEAALGQLAECERGLTDALQIAGLASRGGSESSWRAAAQAAPLLRLRGVALAQAGNQDGAVAVLHQSVESARARQSTQELAMALHSLAWVDRNAEQASREAVALFAVLGIVWVPEPPRLARGRAVDVRAVEELPRQRFRGSVST